MDFLVFNNSENMFGSNVPLSDAEKIDYVYNYVKSEKRSRIVKGVFNLLIYGAIFFGIYYFYFVYIPANGVDKIKSFIMPMVSKMVGDVSKDIINNMGGELMNGLSGGTGSGTGISGMNIPNPQSLQEMQSKMIDQMMTQMSSQIQQQMMKTLQGQMSGLALPSQGGTLPLKSMTGSKLPGGLTSSELQKIIDSQVQKKLKEILDKQQKK